MILRLALFLLAATGGAAFSLGLLQENQSAMRVRGRIPFTPASIAVRPPDSGGQLGEVVVRLEIDSAGRAMYSVVQESPRDLGEVLLAVLRTWRFEARPGTATTLTVKYWNRSRDCGRDMNPQIELHLPHAIDVYQPSVCTDGGAVDSLPDVRGPFIVGMLRDETGSALAGIPLTVHGRGGGKGRVDRLVRTDADGRFEMHGLPDGVYQVEITEVGFVNLMFKMTVSSSLPPSDVPVTLRRDPTLALLPPAVVTAADIPDLPVGPVERVSAGVVDVRLTMVKAEIRDIDAAGNSPELVEVARDNVSTWRFTDVRVPVLPIRFIFQSVDGDCKSDIHPVIEMTFPSLVTITSTRRLGCGTSLSASLPAWGFKRLLKDADR